MIERKVDLVVIGSGPAGLAASIKAYKLGLTNQVVIEREKYLGGVLPQCIHPGFGLKYFKEELTGPEFIQRFIDKVEEIGIGTFTDTTALKISRKGEVIAVNKKLGVMKIKSKAVILATGAREKTRWDVKIPGDRPAGVFTAGLVQKLINIEGYLPGKEAVIIGSGDVGLIMARRLTLEGVKVKGVIEIMPYPGGLQRNIVQCLQDFNIPLYLSHAATEIRGRERVERIKIVKVDENLNPLKGTEKEIKCDTVIFSVGLVPENELVSEIGIEMDSNTLGPVVNDYFQTTAPFLFSCGNSLVIFDLVDYVVENAETAAEGVNFYLKKGMKKAEERKVSFNKKIKFVVPQRVTCLKDVSFYLRVKKPEEKVFLSIKEINWRKYFQKIKPNEMVKVNLKREELLKIKGEKITFKLVRKS